MCVSANLILPLFNSKITFLSRHISHFQINLKNEFLFIYKTRTSIHLFILKQHVV
jgi:hypothetical protein